MLSLPPGTFSHSCPLFSWLPPSYPSHLSSNISGLPSQVSSLSFLQDLILATEKLLGDQLVSVRNLDRTSQGQMFWFFLFTAIPSGCRASREALITLLR